MFFTMSPVNFKSDDIVFIIGTSCKKTQLLNRAKEYAKMRKRDFLSRGYGERNSWPNRNAMNNKPDSHKRHKINRIAWVIAVFSSFANLALIVTKYVNPIVTDTTTSSLTMVFLLIAFLCSVVVSI